MTAITDTMKEEFMNLSGDFVNAMRGEEYFRYVALKEAVLDLNNTAANFMLQWEYEAPDVLETLKLYFEKLDDFKKDFSNEVEKTAPNEYAALKGWWNRVDADHNPVRVPTLMR